MLKGTDNLLSNLERIGQAKLDAAIQACNELGEKILADAKELCPVSPTSESSPYFIGERPINSSKGQYIGTSGSLRDSGTATKAELIDGKIVVEVGFDTDYAAAVHERLNANHKYPGAVNPNAQAKYLEVPINEMRPRAMAYIAEAMRSA